MIPLFFVRILRLLQILLNATPRYDAAGNVVGVIGIGQDVTQELAQQADLLRLLATANAPIVGIDAENCVNEWNQKAVTLTGFSLEEAMGKPLVEEFIEPRAQASVQAVLNNALQGHPQSNYQFTLMTKDKVPLQILLNATPRYDAAGDVVGVIGIGQDVTQELAQQTDLLRLIDTANAPIIGIDAENCVNEWNQKAVALTGFSREEAMGERLVDRFIEPEAQASVQEVLDDALQGRPNENYRFILMTKERRVLQVLLNATPRYDAAGNVIGVIGIGQDVTDIVAEEEVERRANESKRRFLAYVFHEVRQPVQVFSLNLYSLQRHLSDVQIADPAIMQAMDQLMVDMVQACKSIRVARRWYDLI